MTITEDLLNELTQEAAVTRTFLAKVPFDKANFKPHENSEALGRLAIHVAEIIAWWKACIEQSELNFIDFEPENINSTEELLAYFDKLLIEAKAALRKATIEDLNDEWSMKYGNEVLFTLPKKQVLRTFCMNHLVHHRAQLGVYLRIIGIPVPATYGPSADDEDIMLINRY